MAQDFHAAFGVGENDTTISTIDEGGVALAAIQGMNEKLEHALRERDEVIAVQAKAIEQLQARAASLPGLEACAPSDGTLAGRGSSRCAPRALTGNEGVAPTAPAGGIASASARHRLLLLLKEAEGWSVAEIAAALRWNEKRVQNELYKARRALADWRQREAAEGETL